MKIIYSKRTTVLKTNLKYLMINSVCVRVCLWTIKLFTDEIIPYRI